MESIGKYWIPIYNILESTCNIVLAHPKYVKAIKGKKPDRRTQNGLPIFLSMILFLVALFHLQISDNFGTWYAIVVSLTISMLVKRTVHRTV